MEVKLKLYGSSKLLSDKKILNIQLPESSNVEKLRHALTKIISKKNLKNDLNDLSKTVAFVSEKDEIISDKYRLKNNELISVFPPIGGG